MDFKVLKEHFLRFAFPKECINWFSFVCEVTVVNAKIAEDFVLTELYS